MKKRKDIIIIERYDSHKFRDVDKAIFYPWTRTLKVYSHLLGTKCTETVSVPVLASIRCVNCNLKIKY